ncbi:FAM91 N-terminal domain-containing protein [Entamoeba marina]
MSEATYYQKLIDYSIQHMMVYPYHLSQNYLCNTNLHIEKYNPHQYYCQSIKKLLNDGLPFAKLPAFTARDVFRLLGISRNKFTEMSNKYKADKKKLLTRKPTLTFDMLKPSVEPWWTIKTMFVDFDGKTVQNEKLASQANPTEIYHENTIIVIPIQEDDCFEPLINDNIIITRTKKFETIYYRLLLLVDNRLSLADLMKILLIDISIGDMEKQNEILKAISFLIRLGRLKRTLKPTPQLTSHSTNGEVIQQPTQNQQITAKRICLIVDESVISTLMTVGKLTSDHVYNLVGLLELLQTQELNTDSKPHIKKFLAVAKSLVNIIRCLQPLISNIDVFDTCDGIEIHKTECLDKLSQKEIIQYRKKYTAALIGINSKLISCEHVPFCPQIIPHQAFNSYAFLMFISKVYESGVPSLLLPCGSFLHVLPDSFNEMTHISVNTFSHHQETLPMANALLFINESLRTQPLLIRGFLTEKPTFESIVFPLKYSTSSFKTHPVIVEISQTLGLDKFCGKIVMVNPTNTPTNDFNHWYFYDIIFGIPMDDVNENKQCVESLKELLIDTSIDDVWGTSYSVIHLFFRFLSNNGYDNDSLEELYSNQSAMKLYPPNPIAYTPKQQLSSKPQ